MTPKENQLGHFTASIRAHSDSLVSAGTDDRAIAAVKGSQNRVNAATERFSDLFSALCQLSAYNNDSVSIDWSDVRIKLSKAVKWLEKDLTSWSASELVDLADSISKISTEVQEKLAVEWEKTLQRVVRVRALLEFFPNSHATTLVLRSKLFSTGATPKTMVESIDFLKEAEVFAEKNGVADPEIARFLEGTTLPGGSPIEFLDSENVRIWLSQENRIDRFSIRFKDGDV
jgi:hypothetical protein